MSSLILWASLVTQLGKNLPAMLETWVRSVGWEDPWIKERIPTPIFWPGESHGLYIHGSQRVRHDWETFTLSFFSYSTQQQWTVSGSDCDVWRKVDFIWQPGMTSSVAGRRRSSKALPKAKLAPKNGQVTVWCSAARLIHYSFLNPSETITSEKYARKSIRCTENCNACSEHWSTQRSHFSTTTPDCMSHNQCFKSWQVSLWSFVWSTIFTWPLANRLPLLQASQQLFAGKIFNNQQEAENTFQEFIESWSMDFYATGISKLISHWQKCVDYNNSYFH